MSGGQRHGMGGTRCFPNQTAALKKAMLCWIKSFSFIRLPGLQCRLQSQLGLPNAQFYRSINSSRHTLLLAIPPNSISLYTPLKEGMGLQWTPKYMLTSLFSFSLHAPFRSHPPPHSLSSTILHYVRFSSGMNKKRSCWGFLASWSLALLQMVNYVTNCCHTELVQGVWSGWYVHGEKNSDSMQFIKKAK